MMNILIQGIEMPRTYPITVEIYPDGAVFSKTVGRMDIHGTAVPIRTHGRLIDADALVKDNGLKEIPEYYEVVCNAPTIIPVAGKEGK